MMMMARGGPSADEDIYNSIKELLLNIDPLVRATGPPNRTVEELARSLRDKSSTQGSSYALVKQIRQRIRTELSHAIECQVEATVEKYHKDSEANLLIGSIGDIEDSEKFRNEVLEKVCSTETFATTRSGIRRGVDSATERLVGNFDAELDPMSVMNNQLNWFPRSRRQSMTSISDLDSIHSSASFFDFGLMNAEQFAEFVDSMSSNQSMDVRLRALNTLYNIPSVELLSNQQLVKLLPGLREAVASFNAILAHLSLEFHAKMLASSSYVAIKEMYVNLVFFLRSEFHSRKLSDFMPMLEHGMAMNKPEHQRYPLIMRLLHKCQLSIVDHWIRFPESYVVTIIDKTMELLFLRPRLKGVISPLHLWALLDPEMTWLHRWLRSKFSRTKVLKIVFENKDWLQIMTGRCLRFLKRENILPSPLLASPRAIKTLPVYSREMLDYLYYFSCLKILGVLMMYGQSRKLFPLVVAEQSLSAKHLVLSWCKLLFMKCNCSSNVLHDRYCLNQCLKDMMVQLLHCGSSCRTLMTHEEVVNAFAAPIAKCIESFTNQEEIVVSEVHLLTACELLECYAMDAANRDFVLHTRMLHMLQAFAVLLHQGGFSSELGVELFSSSLKSKVLELCCWLYTNHSAVYSFYDSPIPCVLLNAWREDESSRECSTTPVQKSAPDQLPTLRLVAGGYELQEQRAVDNLCLLTLFGATPLGILKLQTLEVLEDCIYCMTQSMFIKDQEPKSHWWSTLKIVVCQASCCVQGIRALQANGYLQHLVSNLWYLTEHNSVRSFGKTEVLSTDYAERCVRKNLDWLMSLTTTYTAVRLLMNQPPAPEISGLSTMSANSLSDLIQLTVLRDISSCFEDLLRPDQTCLLGLWVLSSLVNVLDSSLYLQAQFHYQDILLEAQSNNIYDENNAIIYDELSVVRNYILIKVLIVGGPSEKMLPPRNLSNMHNEVTDVPLFSTRIVPDVYRIKPSSVAMSSECPLTQFVGEQTYSETIAEWQSICYQALSTTLMDDSYAVKDTLLLQLIEKWLSVCEDCGLTTSNPTIGTGFMELNEEYNLGIDLTIEYGQYLGLLKNCTRAKDDLANLLLLYLNNMIPVNCLQIEAIGFPWFVATLFLLSHGNTERCLAFLQKFYCVPKLSTLWFVHAHNCRPQGVEIQARLCHCVEHILSLEMPFVHSSFKLCTSSPSSICLVWVQQCFWNYLDWAEICQFVTICILLGPEYLVYYLIAVFSYLQANLLKHAQEEDLNTFLLEEPLRDFKMKNYLFYMNGLRDKYKSLIHL